MMDEELDKECDDMDASATRKFEVGRFMSGFGLLAVGFLLGYLPMTGHLCAEKGHYYEARYDSKPPAAAEVFALGLSGHRALDAMYRLTTKTYTGDICIYCGEGKPR